MVLNISRKKERCGKGAQEQEREKEKGRERERGAARKLLALLVCTCTPDALCLSSGMCLWEQFNHWPTQPLPQKSDPDNPLSLLHCVCVFFSPLSCFLYLLSFSSSLQKMCLNLFFTICSHKVLLSLTTDYSMCSLKHILTHFTSAGSHSYTGTHADCTLMVIHEPWQGNKIKLEKLKMVIHSVHKGIFFLPFFPSWGQGFHKL